MKLTWHIVLKDLRRLWPWLAVLVGAMLARYTNFYTPGSAPGNIEPISLYDAEQIDFVLFGLSLFTTALSAAALVHQDAVTGSRAFWLTRPISGLRLLAAKTLTFTLALLLLPLVVQVGWWLTQNYSLGDITAQIPSMFTRHAGIAFASFCFAFLTRNLGSFILTTLVTSFVIVAAHAFLVDEWLKLPSRADAFNRERLQLIAVLITLPVCVIHQYTTRRTRRTLVMLGATLVLSLAIHAAWPWPLFSKPARFSELPVLAFDPPIRFSIGPLTPSVRTSRVLAVANRQTPPNKPAFAIALTQSAVPAEYIVQILDARFPRNSGRSLDFRQFTTLPFPAHPEQYTHTGTLSLFAKDSQVDHHLATTLDATLTLALRHLETAARLPLESNACASLGPRGLRIADIRKIHGEETTSPDRSAARTRNTSLAQKLAILVDETLPTYLLAQDCVHAEADRDSASSLNEFPESVAENNPRHAYFLVYRRDGSVTRADTIVLRTKLSVDGVRRRLVRAEFPISLTEADHADYELIKIVAPLVGTFTRTITFPPARWTDPTTP
jgi:hypothetical protein